MIDLNRYIDDLLEQTEQLKSEAQNVWVAVCIIVIIKSDYFINKMKIDETKENTRSKLHSYSCWYT